MSPTKPVKRHYLLIVVETEGDKPDLLKLVEGRAHTIDKVARTEGYSLSEPVALQVLKVIPKEPV